MKPRGMCIHCMNADRGWLAATASTAAWHDREQSLHLLGVLDDCPMQVVQNAEKGPLLCQELNSNYKYFTFTALSGTLHY